MRLNQACVLAVILALAAVARADEQPLKQDWDYAAAMKKVEGQFHGRSGVVLHVGDSITYANPYSQWARYGKGHTRADDVALKWMHAGANDDTDGWYLCSADHPDGGRSYTACGGIRTDEMLEGGKSHMPPLSEILDQYKPQVVVLMLGTNDASAGRPVEAYREDIQKAIRLMLDRGIVPIISTIPPHPGREKLAIQYNQAIREIARRQSLSMIDYEREILKRRPNDWNGTLIGRNDVHPTAEQGGATAASEPAAENLRNSGYLLRGWLSVRKIEEVKERVLDGSSRKENDARSRQTTGPAIVSAQRSPRLPKSSNEQLKLAVMRDTWFSDVGKERDCNLGAATSLKLKSIQEMSVIDIDPSPLKGRTIVGAWLHVRKRGDEVLGRVTVSSFAADWVEGTSASYAPQEGSSCFSWRRFPDVPWAHPGSDLTAVMLSQGGTIWAMADASPPDAEGWMTVPVDVAVVAARVAGVSQGFLLFDDTGSEWTRDGENFHLRLMPNRFMYSREQGAGSAPYLTVALGPEDHKPPAAPAALQFAAMGLPAGEARVSWQTPSDSGPAGVAGFAVKVNGKALPQYLVPAPGKPGDRVTMRLRDLGLQAGQSIKVQVAAIDGAGNIGTAAEISGKVSGDVLAPLGGEAPKEFSAGGVLPRLTGAEIAILDALDKVEPQSGQMIPPQLPEYLSGNHLWSASEKRIRLSAAGNEFVSFQISLRGPVKDLKAQVEFTGGGDAPQVTFYQMADVPSKVGKVPDPLLALEDPFTTPSGERISSLLCEIYVPHKFATGAHSGTLTLSSGAEQLKLAIDLKVWNFSLPDRLSFIPELNCYGLPENEIDYYRLAHRNRAVINRVPYSQSGHVTDGCGPVWDGKTLDWSAWDKRFGPLLDGSAFADLPRKAIPLDIMYLPLNENWPSPMEGNYNGSYWADQAFPPAYRATFVHVSKQFAEHFNQKHWDSTIFQCFFNGKNNFKEHGWSHGSSPWLLDEPMNFQDFWALRWFGLTFHEGVDPVAGSAKMMFRCDISRPQWQRDALDGVLNYNVVGGEAFHRYHRLVMDRKMRLAQLVIPYGSSNNPADSNMQPVGWCWDSWTLGADGVLPWQVIGSDESWKKAEDTCLFYPGGPGGRKQPVPSIRLKAYLRGEQDAEYLTLLAKVEKQSQLQLGRRVRAIMNLNGQRKVSDFTGAEDAGVIDVANLKPQDVWAVRQRIGQLISTAAPPDSGSRK